jgi:hypothetical protein
VPRATAAQGIPIAILSALRPAVGGRVIDVVGFGMAFKLCIATLLAGAVLISLPCPAHEPRDEKCGAGGCRADQRRLIARRKRGVRVIRAL